MENKETIMNGGEDGAVGESEVSSAENSSAVETDAEKTDAAADSSVADERTEDKSTGGDDTAELDIYDELGFDEFDLPDDEEEFSDDGEKREGGSKKPRKNRKLPGFLGDERFLNNSYLGLCFLVPALTMWLIYIAMGTYPFGNGSVLVLDLNGQYIYFFEQLRDIVLGDGSFLYCFGRALGGEFMGIYLAVLFSSMPVPEDDDNGSASAYVPPEDGTLRTYLRYIP